MNFHIVKTPPKKHLKDVVLIEDMGEVKIISLNFFRGRFDNVEERIQKFIDEIRGQYNNNKTIITTHNIYQIYDSFYRVFF